jgi:hypothetical protein
MVINKNPPLHSSSIITHLVRQKKHHPTSIETAFIYFLILPRSVDYEFFHTFLWAIIRRPGTHSIQAGSVSQRPIEDAEKNYQPKSLKFWTS